MRFDYVDIGTSDFETSLEGKSSEETILLVEPLFHYLRNLPDEGNIFKANFAISNKRGFDNIYYVKESDINKYHLPAWVRGCNSLGKPHVTVVKLLQEMGHPESLIATQGIRVITFEDLVRIFAIKEIGQLKIDTEGHDHYILPGVIKLLQNGKLDIPIIICEYLEAFGNTEALNIQLIELLKLGYIPSRQGDNLTITRS